MSLTNLPEDYGQEWFWPGFIPEGLISGVLGNAGEGKTLFLLDICKRTWYAEDWPDGTEMQWSGGHPTLWVTSDGQRGQIAEFARKTGMPKEAFCFNATKRDLHGGRTIDTKRDLRRLRQFIHDCAPAMVIVDSLTYANTRYDLNKADEVGRLLLPLAEIARERYVPIVCTVHSSLAGGPQGRHSSALLRVIMKLEQRHGKRILSVSKSYDMVPPKLVVEVTDTGNVYSAYSETPEKRERLAKAGSSPGRPSVVVRVKQEIFKLLDVSNDQTASAIFSAIQGLGIEAGDRTFRNALQELERAGQVVVSGRGSDKRVQRPVQVD